MPRYKALAALAFIGVLISAGSVGSQDPFLARSEAESAASAMPIAPAASSDTSFGNQPTYRSPVESVVEPVAHAAPASITPQSSVAPNVTGNPAAALAATRPAEHTLTAAVSRSTAAPITSTPSPLLDRVLADAPPALAAIDAAPEFSVAERRLLSTVPDDIEGYFDLFMYASKSNRGPLAQRMFVFQRDADGRLVPYAEWRISTGREKLELHHERKIRTATPEGVFALNPNRFHRKYWSKTWDGAPMHYAMFYDLKNNGNQSGLAIHAAIGKDKIRRLGRRDSAGCIRLLPKHAKELFLSLIHI